MAPMNNFITKNLKYPTQEPTILGKVYVIFVVERDGSLSNIKVLKGLDKGYNEEAIAVIKKMPK
jgi:periplasmic protein TonB